MISDNGKSRWDRFIIFYNKFIYQLSKYFGILPFLGVASIGVLFRILPCPFEQEITGCISNAKSVQEPVAGVELVVNNNKPVITDADGCFKINMRWEKYQDTILVKAKKLGFRPEEKSIDLGREGVNFQMFEFKGGNDD